MKRTTWIKRCAAGLLLFCFAAAGLLPLHAEEQAPARLRVLTYNIWNGFEGDTLRRAKFIAFMQREAPDVVSLDELVGFTAEGLAELARAYGHPYSAIVKEEGYPVGLTSRYPIEVVSRRVDGFWHGFLHARTAGLDCLLTHLSPFEWRFRWQEAQQITAYVREQRLERYVLMGDLNAASPLDADALAEKDSLLADERAWDAAQEHYRNLRDGRFDFSVLSLFLAEGMEDAVGRLVHPALRRVTFPTAFLYGKPWGDRQATDRQRRLDYILLSPALMPHCVGAEVHNGADLEGISDHYPVRIDLLLTE